MRLIKAVGLVLVATPVLAQREHPISSELRVPAALSVKPGDRFSVTLAVTIPSAPQVWHLYSITQAPGGPIATTISVGPSSVFRVAGMIQGSTPDLDRKSVV